MADIGDRAQFLPKETQTAVKNSECNFHFGCQNYDNGLFYIQDRDVYHHKLQNHVNQVSMFDNYVPDCSNFMSCGEHERFVNISPTVGQVETDIVYNSDINQFQDGCQYLHACEQYLIQFTNGQFIDHNRRGSIFLIFIQKVEKGDNNGLHFMHADHYDNKMLFYRCIEPPTGYLEILYSCVIPLYASDVLVIFDYEIHTEDVLRE